MNAVKLLQDMKNTLMAKLMLVIAAFMVTSPALALEKIDLTESQDGGSFNSIAGNIDDAAQTAAALLIQLVTIGGFVVVALSLYQLYKASKDEREQPMSAFVGLFIGGAMASVGSIMWMMKNTIVA